MTAIEPGISTSPAGEAGTVTKRNSAMEQVIETLANGLGNSVGWLAENGVLFGIFAVIWVAFAAGLIWSQGSLDEVWSTVRGLPLIVQAVVWLLFLPLVVGLWVWETTWPIAVRLAIVIGIAGWNLLVLLPRAAQTIRP